MKTQMRTCGAERRKVHFYRPQIIDQRALDNTHDMHDVLPRGVIKIAEFANMLLPYDPAPAGEARSSTRMTRQRAPCQTTSSLRG
jgi:hypothetical protein